METETPTNLMSESVFFSEEASLQIKEVIKQQENQDLAVRIYVQGGCGGITYGMALDSKITSDDWQIEIDGLKVIVDRISLPYVQGASVEYQTEGGAGFKITNPNVDLSSGGCGSGGCGTGGCGSGSGGCC